MRLKDDKYVIFKFYSNNIRLKKLCKKKDSSESTYYVISQAILIQTMK